MDNQHQPQIIPVTHKPREGSLSLADGANELQHTENITTEDGSHLKVTRSVRALSNDPYGRHVRETRERIGRNIHGLSDFQAENYTREDGTRVKRTQVQSQFRFSGNRPPIILPALTAADPAVFFNDPGSNASHHDSSSTSYGATADHDSERAYARAQDYLKYNNGIPYPKGFMPSPTFWHPYSVTRSGVSVAFEDQEDNTHGHHSRSSFRSSSHTHLPDDKHTNNRPSSLTNSHISSTPDRLRSHSAFLGQRNNNNNNNNITTTNTKYSQLQSSSFIQSSSSSTKNQVQQLRNSSFSNLLDQNSASMQAIHENAKVPLITENMAPNFTYQIENVSVEKGGTAYFRGTVNGSYPFDTIWYLNNNELRSTNPNIETSIRRDYTETYLTGLIDYIVSLKVHNCTQRDAGKYTAYIRNEHGSSTSSAFLVVGGTFFFIRNFFLNNGFSIQR